MMTLGWPYRVCNVGYFCISLTFEFDCVLYFFLMLLIRFDIRILHKKKKKIYSRHLAQLSKEKSWGNNINDGQ